MIMPSTPRRTLIASLAAAAMGADRHVDRAPCAGMTSPPLGTSLVMYVPDFIWAGDRDAAVGDVPADGHGS